MYGIYRAATQVIVWFGIEADDSDFIMRAMALSEAERIGLYCKEQSLLLLTVLLSDYPLLWF
jgi:hypothetical protein